MLFERAKARSALECFVWVLESKLETTKQISSSFSLLKNIKVKNSKKKLQTIGFFHPCSRITDVEGTHSVRNRARELNVRYVVIFE